MKVQPQCKKNFYRWGNSAAFFRFQFMLILLFLLPVSAVNAQYQLKNFTVAGGYANGKLTGSSVQANVVVGQSAAELMMTSPQNSITAGLYGFYLLPPDTTIVVASQGDFPDRVEVTWTYPILSPPADVDYFQIYRDGTLLSNVPASQTFYKDFNVQPGNYYEYKVVGVNEFGLSPAGFSVGFINPNGTFTGKISTKNGAPVKEVEITVVPNLGKALQFNGFSTYMDAGSKLDLRDTSFTIEFWLKRNANDYGKIFTINSKSSSVDSQLTIAINNAGAFTVSANATTSATIPISEDSLWHHYAWVFNESTGKGMVYRDSTMLSAFNSTVVKGTGQVVFGRDANNAYTRMNLDETRIWKKALDSTTIVKNMYRTVNSNSAGLAAYWKFDEGKGNRVFDFATKINTGVLNGAVQFLDDRAPVRTSAFSDSTGLYIVEGINYGTSTNFTVTPLKSGRSFSPATRLLTLSTSNTAVNNIDFTDISQLPVSGYITHAVSNCPVDTNVEVLVDGASWSPKIHPDLTGKFQVEFPPGESHTLTPYHSGYVFSPASTFVDSIVTPQTNRNFSQLKTYNLKVVVAGGLCEYQLRGLTTVKLSSLPSCFTTILADSAKNFYFTGLAPMRYKLEVSRPDLIRFEDQVIDLTDTSVINNSNRTIKFIYRAPLAVKIDTTLLPTRGSCGTATVVLSQLNKYVVRYTAGEQYDAGFCPVDSVTFTVFNFIGDEGASRALFALHGTVNDTIYAGYPNTLDGGPHPFQKQLLVKAGDLLNRAAQNDFWALVAGIKPRVGQTFVSRSPDMPLLILRAPPGDFSWSYWSQQMTAYSQLSISQDVSSGFGLTKFVSLVPKFESTLGMGFAVDTEVKPVVEAYHAYNTMAGITKLNSLNLFMTATENITTPMDPIHTGHNSDVFVGAAFNFVFGKADSLYFQEDSCLVKKKVVLISAPDSIASKYIYTEDHITQVLIPNLTDHMNSFPLGSITRTNDSLAINNWSRLIAYNDSLKQASGDSLKNISFSAGPFYTHEEQFTRDSSFTFTSYQMMDTTEGGGLGIFINEAGFRIDGAWAYHTGYQRDSLVGVTATTTSGYTLGDDDGGDFFSVNIAKDRVFNTPVFRTVAGASSCPWEPGTMQRNLAVLAPRYLSAINLMPDSVAAFPIYLGNASGTDETSDYIVKVLQATNPDGATIAVNGVPLENGMTFTLAPGQTQAILTLKRGPLAYDYDNIRVELTTACGDDQVADTLTVSAHFLRPCSPVVISQPDQNWLVNLANHDSLTVSIAGYDKNNVNTIKLQYRPTLGSNSPLSNPFLAKFGKFNSEGKLMKVDLTTQPVIRFNKINGKLQIRKAQRDAYDAFAESRSHLTAKFELPVIRQNTVTSAVVQKQKPSAALDETGTTETGKELTDKVTITDEVKANWTTFATLQKTQLGNTYTSTIWQTNGLNDGTYELRAVTNCGGSTIDGTSISVFGTIDKTPPMVMGLPQPSSGILTASDQIAITFSKQINVNTLSALNNMQLYYTDSGQPIDFNFSSDGHTIIMVPNVADRYIENRVLKAVVKHVRDLHGNLMKIPVGTSSVDSIAWEFVVNKSPVRWSGGDITIVKYIDESASVTRNLVNLGGFATPYYLRNLPSWVAASSLQGTVPNHGLVPITFTVGTSLSSGIYDATIIDSTIYGDQPLRIHLQVLCHPPAWQVNPASYQYSMNIIGKLYIDTALSTDIHDKIGVFVGNEVRGTTDLQKLGDGSYRAFLTVYSNQEVGEPLQMRVWDSSACNEYGQILEQYTFQANAILGTYSQPVPITATLQTIQQYKLSNGWTWLSFNTKSADMSVSTVLYNLNASPGDIIKEQGPYAQYVSNHLWFGTLDTIRATKMYMMKLTRTDSISRVGYPISPADYPVKIDSGWNYIGYLPQASLPVNTALRSLHPGNNDLIKSQFSFAIYDAAAGWVGNLFYMQPRQGYFLKASRRDTLIYPSSAQLKIAPQIENPSFLLAIEKHPEWTVPVNNYQYSMSVLAVLDKNIIDSVSENVTLGTFYNSECRGFTQAQYIEQMHGYAFFLTVYSNALSGDSLLFRIYDGRTDKVIALMTGIKFKADALFGSLSDPLIVRGTPLEVQNGKIVPLRYELAQNYPNPFNPATTIKYAVPFEGDVTLTVYNIMGERVRTLVSGFRKAGFYSVVFDGRSDHGSVLPSGIYLYSMKAGKYSAAKKLTLLK